MVPAYDQFMRPLLTLLKSGARTYSELAPQVRGVMELPEAAEQERISYDGMEVIEARIRKAAHDLEKAGLVVRSANTVVITDAGRTVAEGEQPLSLAYLEENFAAYRAYRAEYLARRGA